LKRKREIASVLADSYVLSGKFTLRPHPVLLKVAALEPLKTGSHQVGGGGSDPESPSQRRGWDAIRILLTGSELSFEYRVRKADRE